MHRGKPMRSRIVLADDHVLFRGGLRSILERQPGLSVVGEASTGREAVDLVQSTGADLVVMDLVMPELNGIEATRTLTRLGLNVKIIVVSAHSEGHFVGQVLQAGASAYVLKSADMSELIDAIQMVRKDQTYLSRGVADVVIDRYVRNNGHTNGNGNGADSPADRLTSREREVLQLIAEGHATKQIALRLSVSIKTIETHRQALMRKLEMRSIAHLTKYAVREGITTLEY